LKRTFSGWSLKLVTLYRSTYALVRFLFFLSLPFKIFFFSASTDVYPLSLIFSDPSSSPLLRSANERSPLSLSPLIFSYRPHHMKYEAAKGVVSCGGGGGGRGGWRRGSPVGRARTPEREEEFWLVGGI
jgi:hypothetical protein